MILGTYCQTDSYDSITQHCACSLLQCGAICSFSARDITNRKQNQVNQLSHARLHTKFERPLQWLVYDKGV